MLLAALTGCASSDPVAAPSVTPEAPASESPTPTPTPTRPALEVVTDPEWWHERYQQVAIMRVESAEWELASLAATDAAVNCPV